MYCIAMEEIAQGTQPVVVPAGLGCEQDGEQPNRADAAQINVATGLVRLSFLVQGIYARVSERHQLTPVQAKLLCAVADGPQRMADLASHFGVEKAALTGLVDRVGARGRAERTAVPGDRQGPCARRGPPGRRARPSQRRNDSPGQPFSAGR